MYKPSSANLMPTRWSRSQYWSACFMTAYGPLFVPRPSKMAIGKTPWSRPLRRPSLLRPKTLLTFYSGSEKWMFAVHRAINLFSRQINAPMKKLLTGIFPSLRILDPSLLNAPKTPKSLTSLGRIIEMIIAIEKIVIIMTFTAQNFQAPPQLLGLI